MYEEGVMEAIGSILRGLVVAVVVAAVAFIAGALAGSMLCGDGACAWGQTPAAMLRQPAPGFGEAVSAAMLVGGLLVLGLIIALTPREPVLLLAGIFALLIAIIGFLLWIPQPEPTAKLPAPETEPLLERRPAAMATPEPEPLSCPTGQFATDGACSPCYETLEEPVPAALRFQPVQSGANWVYARATRIEAGGEDMAVETYVDRLSARTDFCEAPALLVVGSASSDGERSVNEERAMNRAKNLGAAARSACGNGVRIFALSLGQSEAPSDVPEDRPVTIFRMTPATGAEIGGDLILSELGHYLYERERDAAIFARRDRFPRPWTGPSGEIDGLPIKPRQTVETVLQLPGAPDSCAYIPPEGVDERPPLRQ